jgi:hypothetical protein
MIDLRLTSDVGDFTQRWMANGARARISGETKGLALARMRPMSDDAKPPPDAGWTGRDYISAGRTSSAPRWRHSPKGEGPGRS